MKTGKYLTKFRRSVLVAVSIVSIGIMPFAAPTNTAFAAAGACTTPATDYGTVTLSLNVGVSGNYYIWTRMAAATSSANTYLLQVDTASCFNVGSSATKTVPTYTNGSSARFASGNTNWINNATDNSRVQASLSAGTHTIKLIGNAQDVVVDRLAFILDGNCVPTGTGDTCVGSTDTTAPSVSITSPADGATISGTSTIKATASDDVAVTKLEYYVDGTLKSTLSASPYNYSLDTTTLSNAPHVIKATAYDAANNSSTDTINVTVNNATPPSDTTPPSVNFSGLPTVLNRDSVGSPYNSTSYNISATASDASGIKNVVFKVDGTTKSTDTTSPYGFVINLSLLTCGTHSFSAIATDNSTNQNTNSVNTSAYVTYGADINSDCKVDFFDISSLSSKYGKTSSLGRSDINGDGKVDFFDISALSSKYGV